MLSIWKRQGYLSTPVLSKIQQKVDAINPPCNIGRIPGKIAAGFVSCTVEQLMRWAILYSFIVLCDVLPSQHYSSSLVYVSKACSLLCRPYMHQREVAKADELLSFCHGFERLYGKQACTPNLHMQCHLKSCILDVGPIFSFLVLLLEYYNGILESMKMSWCAPELQLLHKFNSIQSLAAAILPEHAPPELVNCYQKAMGYRTIYSPTLHVYLMAVLFLNMSRV